MVDTYRQVAPLLIRLCWSTHPPLFTFVLFLSTVEGFIPLGVVWANATLLRMLVTREAATAPVFSQFPVALPLSVLAGLLFLDYVLRIVKSALTDQYALKLRQHVREQIAQRAFVLPLAAFETPSLHDELTMISEGSEDRLMSLLYSGMQLVTLLTGMVSLGGALLLWRPWVMGVLLLTAGMMIWVEYRFGTLRYMLQVDQLPAQRRAKYWFQTLTTPAFAKEVRWFQLGNLIDGYLRRIHGSLYQEVKRLNQKRVAGNAGFLGPLSLVVPALIGVVFQQAYSGQLSVSQFAFYSQAIFQVQRNAIDLFHSFVRLREDLLFLRHLTAFLERPQKGGLPPEPPSIPVTTPAVAFQDVSFAYPHQERPILDRLNFTLVPGEVVALVGENGAGKSTLVKILTGLYQATAGIVTFDGADIRDLPPESLHPLISIVPQDYVVFDTTIRDNIVFGDLQRPVRSAELDEVVRKSGLSAVLAGLPEGIDTLLGRTYTGGTELSGGQRQLLSVARALWRSSPILVLDEPSSALDVRAEKHFLETLLTQRVNPQQSVLFISHRFSTVRRADRIVVLEHGRVLEEGTHNELIARKGRYHELYSLQLEMYGEVPG